jgi:hypothetical protein
VLLLYQAVFVGSGKRGTSTLFDKDGSELPATQGGGFAAVDRSRNASLMPHQHLIDRR